MELILLLHTAGLAKLQNQIAVMLNLRVNLVISQKVAKSVLFPF